MTAQVAPAAVAEQTPSKRPRVWSYLAPALLAATAAALIGLPPAGRTAAAALAAARPAEIAAERAMALETLGPSWKRLATPPATVWYSPGVRAQAKIVAATAVRYYPLVARDFGIHGGPWPIVVVSRAQMTDFVGGASSDPPLGAYYRGIVWVLEPSAVVGPDDTRTLYEAYGPLPHELTHLAEDLLSGGRVPPWLNEGIAQYEDWRLTGYVWVSADNAFGAGDYTWTDLTRGFDTLPDTALAYREALAATAMVCSSRRGTCVQLLRLLHAGWSADAAIAQVAGPRTLARLRAGAAWKGIGPEPGPYDGAAP